MSAIQFLWINLVSDVLPALALAVEPPESDVLRRPPRDPRAELVDRAELTRIATDGAVLAASTLGVHASALARYGAGPRATTLSFSTLTAAQLMYALACRSRVVDDAVPGRSSLPLSGVVGGTLALQAATAVLPPLRRLLGTVPLSAGDWALIAAGVAAPTVFAEIRRAPGGLPAGSSIDVKGGHYASQKATP
jgi:Ca2+-transporting ATPase